MTFVAMLSSGLPETQMAIKERFEVMRTSCCYW